MSASERRAVAVRTLHRAGPLTQCDQIGTVVEGDDFADAHVVEYGGQPDGTVDAEVVRRWRRRGRRTRVVTIVSLGDLRILMMIHQTHFIKEKQPD